MRKARLAIRKVNVALDSPGGGLLGSDLHFSQLVCFLLIR